MPVLFFLLKFWFDFSQPSHGDKAANPEVLRWVNELSKLRKDLKGELVLQYYADSSDTSAVRLTVLNRTQADEV